MTGFNNLQLLCTYFNSKVDFIRICDEKNYQEEGNVERCYKNLY